MKITTRNVGDVSILDISGKITIGEGSVVLRERVRQLLEEGARKLLLNFGDVNYVDSSGIGELVSSYTTCNARGASLKLVNLTKKVQDLLVITKLITIFEIYDNEDEAVASFS